MTCHTTTNFDSMKNKIGQIKMNSSSSYHTTLCVQTTLQIVQCNFIRSF